MSAFAAEPKASTYVGPAVTVVKATKTCFTDSIDITGTLVPKQEILVRPEREGLQISNILVEGGETVTSGQILARLTPPEGQGGGAVTVESPAAGVVGKVSAVVGTLTSFQAPPLFQIVAKGEIELLAEVPTKIISQLSPGQPAKVKVMGIGVLPGRVRLVSPTVDAASQLGSARIFIGDDKRLRIGTFGRASIVAGKAAASPFLSRQCFTTRPAPLLRLSVPTESRPAKSLSDFCSRGLSKSAKDSRKAKRSCREPERSCARAIRSGPC